MVLMHRREPGPYFDERLGGWHAYGVDACCEALKRGYRNYVVDAPVWHDSYGTNVQGLEDAHRYVWRKHGGRFREIFTTCGSLPKSRWRIARRRGRRVLARSALRALGHRNTFMPDLDRFLERLTAGEPAVHCWHGPAGVDVLEARGFVPVPGRPRVVTHRFGQPFAPHPGCHVLTADLAWGDVALALRALAGRRWTILVRRYEGLRGLRALFRAPGMDQRTASYFCSGDLRFPSFVAVDFRPVVDGDATRRSGR
jgi:hypothetical protein